MLTWIKPPPFGLGSYFRNSTEHVLFATLGDTTTRPAAASISTHFNAPRGEHSEKPEVVLRHRARGIISALWRGQPARGEADFTNLFVERGSEAAE